MATSHPIPSWLEALKAEYESSPALQELVRKFDNGELDLTCFTRLRNYCFTGEESI